MVYVASAVTDIGVPEITPVDALRLRPAGSPGLTLYVVTDPPTPGVSVAMACPTVAEIVV
jgi:hypothetical protein